MLFRSLKGDQMPVGRDFRIHRDRRAAQPRRGPVNRRDDLRALPQDAGGDSRGRQSASILVVRKTGGRNTNNDRYVYINVDDHPEPMRELRRLLDIQMTGNHQTLMNRALADNRFADALRSAEHLARYSPLNAQSHMILGFAAYLADEQGRALAAFQRAHELTLPNQFKQIWDNVSSRMAFQKVIEDKAFVSKVMGN